MEEIELSWAVVFKAKLMLAMLLAHHWPLSFFLVFCTAFIVGEIFPKKIMQNEDDHYLSSPWVM